MIYDKYEKMARDGEIGSAAIEDEFRDALFIKHGVDSNDKRHKAYDLAREMSNARSYYAIECRFMDLIELIV